MEDELEDETPGGKPQSIKSERDSGKKRRKTRLKPAEQTAIAVMLEQRKSLRSIAKSLNRDEKTIRNWVRDAREILSGHLEDYAHLHRIGAEIAAEKGDTRPAEWALERLKVVEKAQGAESTGFTVKIGVVLPGLGTTAKLGIEAGDSANVLEGETLDDSE